MLPTIVTSLSAHPIDLRLTEPFAIAGGTQHVAANVVVRVTLSDGTIGLGEAAPFPAVSGETQERTLSALDSMRDIVVGHDVRALRPWSEQLALRFPLEPAARCGVEMALCDAVARHYEMPLWAWFGGQARASRPI